MHVDGKMGRGKTKNWRGSVIRKVGGVSKKDIGLREDKVEEL